MWVRMLIFFFRSFTLYFIWKMKQNERTYEKRINAVVQAALSVLAEQEIR